MFILVYFLVVSLSQVLINADKTVVAYKFNKESNIALAILFLIAVALQILTTVINLNTYLLIIVGLYAISSIIYIIVFISYRKKEIERKEEEVNQLFKMLQPITKLKEIDYSELPFKMSYKHGNVNRIDVEVEPVNFNEKNLDLIVKQLDNVFNLYDWQYELHLDERYISFVGDDKPPKFAKWPGSWLHSPFFFPIGVSGKGEVAFQPAKSKHIGPSQYIDEYGQRIQVDNSLAPQPQALVGGAPLSLDTIIPTTKGYKTMGTIEVGDYVFDVNNKPTKVIEVKDIFMSNELYELAIGAKSIKADEKHYFPILNGNTYTKTNTKNIYVGDYILCSDGYIRIDDIKKINNELVRCILVESDEHIFRICFDKHSSWNGSNKYPYFSICTYNTGSGKAIWTEQEID